MTGTNVVLRGVLVLLMVVMAAPLFAQSRPVRVYVFTAEARFVDDESKGRSDSVKDILKALKTKDREVALVDNPTEAELTLEVIGRGYTVKGRRSTYQDYLSGRRRSSRDPKATVWVNMTVDDFSIEIAEDPGTVLFGVWGEAARNLASQVVRWIKDNDAQIPRE